MRSCRHVWNRSLRVVGRQTSANTPALLEMARKSSSIARPKTLMKADKQFWKFWKLKSQDETKERTEMLFLDFDLIVLSRYRPSWISGHETHNASVGTNAKPTEFTVLTGIPVVGDNCVRRQAPSSGEVNISYRVVPSVSATHRTFLFGWPVGHDSNRSEPQLRLRCEWKDKWWSGPSSGEVGPEHREFVEFIGRFIIDV